MFGYVLSSLVGQMFIMAFKDQPASHKVVDLFAIVGFAALAIWIWNTPTAWLA